MSLLQNRKLWLALAAVGLILAVRATGAADYLSLDTLRDHRQALTAFVSENWALAALAYVGVYTAAVAFSLPGAVFLTLSGGFLFGAVSGTILTVIGATIGATLIFLFAKVLFGEKALERFGPQAASLAQNIQKNAWSYLLVLRLVPLFPFFLVNLIPAFAGVGLTTYVLTTFFGIIPGTAVFSLSGAGLGRILEEGGEISPASILTPEIIAALVGLALLSLAAIPLRRRFERKDAAAEGAEPIKR
ncbi:MAG: TVP38/TMEM64 family protein [Hyphomicrobiales bacterium]|nr:TVP38/TMEM64 family protein [Hyphomicrobiales bacterium]